MTTTDLKFCVNCKHCDGGNEPYLCKYTMPGTVNLVTGKESKQAFFGCNALRQDPATPNTCGIEGQFYEFREVA